MSDDRREQARAHEGEEVVGVMVAGIQRVFIHLGLPKTGTSYLQDRMWHNREAALRHGVLYPGGFPEAHFHAAVHIQPERYLAWVDPRFTGAWDQLVKEVRAWPGTSLLSHELLASATEAQAAAALGDLDFAEIHLICTARDLARQIPSVWQENIKNQHETTFADFLCAIRDRHEPQDPFWEFQDLPRILGVWGSTLTPRHVHVITVPPSGGDPTLLWRRFIATVGLEPAQVPADVPTHNQALSLAQVELLRRMNSHLRPDDIEWARYESVVKEYLIGGIMFASELKGGPTLPAADLPWVTDIAEKFVTEITSAGYDVVGGPGELVPVAPKRPTPPPGPDELLDVAIRTLARMVQTMPEAPPKRFSLPARIRNRLLRDVRRVLARRSR